MEGVKQAYVINLNRRRDRLVRFFSGCPLPANMITVIDAVDGKNLEISDWIRTAFKDSKLAYDRYKVACAISHLNVLREIATNQDLLDTDWCLIFEDDAKFRDGALTHWNIAVGNTPENCDFIYLGGLIPSHKPKNYPVNQYFKANDFRIACSYAVTKSAARKIVADADTNGITAAYDCWLNSYPDNINRYIVEPEICYTLEQGDSDVQRKFDSLIPAMSERFVHILVDSIQRTYVDQFISELSKQLTGKIPCCYFGLLSLNEPVDIILVPEQLVSKIPKNLILTGKTQILLLTSDGRLKKYQ